MSNREPHEGPSGEGEHLSPGEFFKLAGGIELEGDEQAFTNELLADKQLFEAAVTYARRVLRDLPHAMDEAAQMAGNDRQFWLDAVSMSHVTGYGLTLEALQDKLRERYPDISIGMVRRIADELVRRGHATWEQVKVRKGEPCYVEQTGSDGTVTVSCLEPVQPLEITRPLDADYETWRVLHSNEAKNGSGRKAKKRAKRRLLPLTAKQLEVVEMVSRCSGNVAKAAKQLGRAASTVREQYNAAMKKIPLLAAKAAKKPKTQRLPTDKRGQSTIPSDG